MTTLFEALRQWLIESSSYVVVVATVLATVAMLANLGLMLRRFSNVIQPYDIAVIGLPRSGKTTLITSMFQAIFFQRFLADRVVPRGSETIDRVNQNLETIQLGRSLGPTAEQDMFAYRVDYLVRRTLFKKTYRMAIGDFAGEYSDQLGDETQHQALYQTTFFKWVMEADAFIFVLDIAAYLRGGKEYLAKVGSEFRSVWQRLVEYHIQGEKNIRRKKVAIVINKCDLLVRQKFEGRDQEEAAPQLDGTEDLWRLGFGDSTPAMVSLSLDDERKINEVTREVFAEIISYFEYQSNGTKVVPVSSFGLTGAKQTPLGVTSLIEFILP